MTLVETFLVEQRKEGKQSVFDNASISKCIFLHFLFLYISLSFVFDRYFICLSSTLSPILFSLSAKGKTTCFQKLFFFSKHISFVQINIFSFNISELLVKFLPKCAKLHYNSGSQPLLKGPSFGESGSQLEVCP